VLSQRPNGTIGVISYRSKLGKGKLAAALLEQSAAGKPVTSATDVAEAWLRDGGRDVRESATAVGCTLDLVDLWPNG
jgi:hypothetical protein